MIFVGDDWAEDHHDVHVMDEAGRRLAARRLPEGLPGIGELHELLAHHADEPAAVVVGIETDRGLWVEALLAAGYQLYAINPLAVARYRDRHQVSGAKSDTADAKVLADLPVRWSAPTGTTIARSPETPRPRRRSRCWPAGIRT
jgi:transposase